jgi:hypothetical protein
MDKKNNILLFAGSVGLIIAAIAVTSLIDFSKSNKNTVIRARATKSVSSMVFTGRVASYDENENILMVDDVRFLNSKDTSLGTWKVTPPATFKSISYPEGTAIRITANPVTFQVADKTLSAYEIER